MKRAPLEPGTELSAAEVERVLLDKLQDEKEWPHDALRQLAEFYAATAQYDKAIVHFRRLMAVVRDVEEKARCVLNMGQVMELAGDYSAAVRYYKKALALKPTDRVVRYFINNNLGFSLNTLGDVSRGEIYCRKAIEIDPERPNGHKNLGIALSGQGWYREAAECFVAATEANALDPRAFNLLTRLLDQHPELEAEFRNVARLCEEAIQRARVRHIH